jgi:hypothetical protein
MDRPTFKIQATSDRFWNKNQFISFLFQNQQSPIELTLAPEAICLETLGVYDLLEDLGFEDVSVVTANPLEQHSKFSVTYLDNHWPRIEQNIDQDLHTWNHTKTFYALFGRPTAARLALSCYLKSHHPRVSHIHFKADTGDDDLVHFELDKLLTYRVSSIRDVGDNISSLPWLLSSTERYTDTHGYDFSDPLTMFYKDILIDMVVESHVTGNTFFPTEKTFRPMWLKKPFIIFASRDYLEYLRQMGFKTFWQFWDESYDGYETKDRLAKIIDLIDWLAAKPVDELVIMYDKMKDILDHNYDLLAQQKYSTQVKKID